jgi:Glycosyl transferase family 11
MSKALDSIIVRIEGGLGNQLFQYACGRSLADRLGCGLALDLRGLDVQGDRPFQLNSYRIRADIADSDLINSLPNSQPSRWGRFKSRAAQLFPIIYSFPIFWSRTFAFDQRFEQLTHPVYLVGYWQSEKYFDWNRAALLNDIQPILPLASDAPWLHEIENTSSVALHIRRGDYVSNAQSAAFHGLCDIAYYQKAVKNLKLHVPDMQVFVFSDEIEWAKKNLTLDVPTHYVESSGVDAGHRDIELMRRCKHHIIANSSFSWWGAWLCTYAGQRVCAPARWFADAKTVTSDVIPARWLKIA